MRRPLDEFLGEDKGIPDAWDLLSPRLGEGRRKRIRAAVENRTSYLRLCLQDVHDPHNVGACLRSAEANGLQYVDFINFYEKFCKTTSTTSRGANHWLDLSRFTKLDPYVRGLRERGYKIAAAYPAQSSELRLEELPIDQPITVVLGNENAGVHEDWAPHIDYRFTIPMFGMTESYNVSVSSALIIYSLTQRIRRDLGRDAIMMGPDSQRSILNRWMSRHSRSLEKELMILRRSANNGASEL